jgi:hypothetical protein
VREESHVEAMRAAIRGDFERLERRRGAQELMRVAVREADPADPAEPTAEEPAPPAPPTRRSWLERLLAR